MSQAPDFDVAPRAGTPPVEHGSPEEAALVEHIKAQLAGAQQWLDLLDGHTGAAWSLIEQALATTDSWCISHGDWDVTYAVHAEVDRTLLKRGVIQVYDEARPAVDAVATEAIRAALHETHPRIGPTTIHIIEVTEA